MTCWLLCQKTLPRLDENLIRRAFDFGFNAHRHDIRASGEPFFDHPYAVAKIVAKEIPLDDVSVAAALLHDVAEDTEYTVDDIREEFGSTVADIVDGATKISDIFKSHDVTQAESYRKMLLSMVNDIRVMLVKFADRLHNMRTLEYLPVWRSSGGSRRRRSTSMRRSRTASDSRTSSGSWRTSRSSTFTARRTTRSRAT